MPPVVPPTVLARHRSVAPLGLRMAGGQKLPAEDVHRGDGARHSLVSLLVHARGQRPRVNKPFGAMVDEVLVAQVMDGVVRNRGNRMAIVTLIDQQGVGTDPVDAIVTEAKLPPGSILVVLGDSLLDPRFQGMTIARAHIRFDASIYGLEDWLQEPWDCGVSIGPHWAERQGAFPAYFAYLLAHELGHATTVLSDLELICFEELIVRYIHVVEKERWDDLPHEVRYDQFGMAVAEAIYGRAEVESEFASIIEKGVTNDVPRIEKALSLEPRHSLDGLRQDLASFCQPYREALLEIWREQRAGPTPGLAGQVPHLESLWEAPSREGPGTG